MMSTKTLALTESTNLQGFHDTIFHKNNTESLKTMEIGFQKL